MRAMILCCICVLFGQCASTQTVQDVLVGLGEKQTVVAAISQDQLSLKCSNVEQLRTLLQLKEVRTEGCLFLAPAKEGQTSPLQPVENQLTELFGSLNDETLEGMWQQSIPISDFSLDQQNQIRSILWAQQTTGHFGQPVWDRDDLGIVIGYQPLVTIFINKQPVVEKTPLENFRWGHSNDSGFAPNDWITIHIGVIMANQGVNNPLPVSSRRSYNLEQLVRLAADSKVYVEPRWSKKPVWFSEDQSVEEATELAVKLYGLKKRTVGNKIVLCQWLEGFYPHAMNAAKQAEQQYPAEFGRCVSRFEQSKPDFVFNGVSQDREFQFSELSEEQRQVVTKLLDAKKLQIGENDEVTVLYEPHLVIGVRVDGEPKTDYSNFPINH